MSYEEKENLKELKGIYKQKREENRVKTALKQDSGSAFKRWLKMKKAGKTPHQKKLGKFLKEE